MIRVAFSGVPDFGDLPSVLAHERLSQAGYVLDVVTLATPELVVDALNRGDADIAHASIPSIWAGVARGAGVRTVMEDVANPYQLVVRHGIRDCLALEGRRLALHSEGAVSTALARSYFQEACPGIQPAIVWVPESDNRAAALASEAVDAAVIDLGALIWLDREARGRFDVLSQFRRRWPHFKTTGIHVRTSFALTNPGAVRDYVRARLEAQRQVLSDPDLLTTGATRVLGPSPWWPETAQAYVRLPAWAPDGGLTWEDVEQSLAFLESHAGLPSGLAPTRLADLSFLLQASRDLKPASRPDSQALR